MANWLIDRVLEIVNTSLEMGVINVSQVELTRIPEQCLLDAIDYMSGNSDYSEAHENMIEFLINCRRYHFAYIQSGELWGFIEQHLNMDLMQSDNIPGPFGIFVEISGQRDGSGFRIIPVTQQDVIENTNPIANRFEGVLDKGDSNWIHVLYSDHQRSIQHKLPFMSLMSQPLIREVENNQIKQNVEILSSFFDLLTNTSDFDDEALLFRKNAIIHLIKTDYDLLKLSFDLICDGVIGEFEHDMFDFMQNIRVGQTNMEKSKNEMALKFQSGENKRAIMIDYRPTRQGQPPNMMFLTPEIANDVISKIESSGDNSAQWRQNLKIIENLDDDIIGIIHTDDELSAKHNFPFDITLTI